MIGHNLNTLQKFNCPLVRTDTKSIHLKVEFEDTKEAIIYRRKRTTKWQTKKVQKDKQRLTKHTHTTKDRVTRTPLETGGELRCFGRVSSFCSTSGTRRVNLVKIHIIYK